MAYEEKELVYNLYPLQVGWQELPVLSLEYNTKADPQKNDSQNALLDELVQRALPKRVFVLVRIFKFVSLILNNPHCSTHSHP